MDRIRDYFGMPKEENEWDSEDKVIILGSALVFLVIASLAYYQSKNCTIEYIKISKLTAAVFLGFSMYSVIVFINLSITNKFNNSATEDDSELDTSESNICAMYRTNENSLSFVSENSINSKKKL